MLKIGDKVRMNDKYHVSAEKREKVWTVCSEPWMCCGTMVVKLDVNGWWKVYGTRTKHVTHWMPMPEPQKE